MYEQYVISILTIFWLYVCPFSFGHCIVCLLISDLWLSFWFLQTFLVPVSYLNCFYVHLHSKVRGYCCFYMHLHSKVRGYCWFYVHLHSKVRGYCWFYYHHCSNQELGGILLNDLTPPPFCACPKPGPGFTTSYVMVFFVFSELRWGDCSFCWYCWNC